MCKAICHFPKGGGVRKGEQQFFVMFRFLCVPVCVSLEDFS